MEGTTQPYTPEHHVSIPVAVMDSLSLKTVLEVTFEQPLSCCYSIQTRNRTRTALATTDVVADLSASGPLDMGDVFVEKFVLALTPFQVILGTGNITEMTVQSIANRNTEHLHCSIGISKQIADAAGAPLLQEFRGHIRTYTTLFVAAVTHTMAGDMHTHINCVVHVAWPVLEAYSDSDTLQRVLLTAVLKTLRYTNDVLRAASLAVPATIAGICNVPPLVILSAIYRSLKEYTNELRRNHVTAALHVVYLVSDTHKNIGTLCYSLFGLFNEDDPIPPPAPVPKLIAGGDYFKGWREGRKH